MNKSEYLVQFAAQFEKLFRERLDLAEWLDIHGGPLFRDPQWVIAPLAGAPWLAVPEADRMNAVELAQLDRADPIAAHHRRIQDRFWRPWLRLLDEHHVERLIFSVYEALAPALAEDDPCCIECGLDWSEIDCVNGTLDVHGWESCAVFSASDEWAMWSLDGFSVLGGPIAFIERYGELAGGWDRLRAELKTHMEVDNEFYDYDIYRRAVEQALENSAVVWKR
ncbi:MAG: hypothetical protein KIT16_03320 [Rhodospirillaceae bacterium]|nr:hypothetical protein [Rhodospirillaceae bacterium]